MRRLLLTLVLASSLASCSVWDLATSFVKPSPGIAVDAELTVGDKTEEVQVTGKSETVTNTAEEINITNVHKSPGFFWSLLFFLGWLLPGPPIPWSKLWSWMFKRKV